MEVYNLERKTDDIKRLLEEKQRAGQEPQGEVDEGQQGEPRPTGPVPREQGGNHQRETGDVKGRGRSSNTSASILSDQSARIVRETVKNVLADFVR